MANIAALTATTLNHFGFNEPTCTYFNAIGLTMIVDLLTLPNDEIKKLFKRWPPTNPQDVPSGDEAAYAQVFIIPFLLHAS